MDYLERMRRAVAFVSISAALLATFRGPVHAAGDAAKGKATAERWCTSCHTVSLSGGGGDTAPGFVSIARMRDDGYLRAVLTEPHSPMPPIALSRYQVDDLVAYFAVLRTQ